MQTQQAIPEQARMSVTLLVQPTAVAQTGTKSRGLAGVALLAAVAGVAAALWSDQLLTRRSRRRRTDADAGAGPGAPAEEPEPAPLVGAAR